MDISSRRRALASSATGAQVAALVAAVALLAMYAVLRYGGLWGEGDTDAFTAASRVTIETGNLVPEPGQPTYPNGYGYQAMLAFLVNLTGLGLSTLQVYGSALLIVWVVIPAWLLYRELTSTSRGATLATVLLFVQPEFLFVIMRGSHEKFTRGLMLVCLYLLIRSLRAWRRKDLFAALVVAFYVSAYALITFNNLLSTSFIVGTGSALAFTWMLSRASWGAQTSRPVALALRRLFNVTFVSLGLAYVVTFYVYEPARHDVLVLRSIGERLASMFLDVQSSPPADPYAVVAAGWAGAAATYLAVSLANWLLLAASASIWLWQSYRYLLGGARPRRRSEVLLWAFYGAFAIQGAVSIAIDFSGAVAGNLQHRIFPTFGMLAAPVLGKWLADWRPGNLTVRRAASAGMWAGIGLLAILSTFKATNEPLLSNKWLFYEPAEMRAIDWATGTLANRPLWTEFDDRLTAAFNIRTADVPTSAQLTRGRVEPGVRDFLISDVTRSRSLRLGQPLPVQADDLVTYDNGGAQIHHRRPLSPYQQ